MPRTEPLTDAEVEDSLAFGIGASAAAGATVSLDAQRDARQALLGDLTFDDAVSQALARARR